MPERRSRAAFSLMELLVAFAIIATALLLIIGIFTNVIESSQKTVDLTSGTMIAEYLMDAEVYQIMNNPARRTNFFNNPAPMSGATAYAMGTAATLNQTVFSYVIYSEQIGAPFNVNGNRLMKIDVIVWWWRPGAAGEFTKARQGYGYLRTQLTRLVNEKSKF